MRVLWLLEELGAAYELVTHPFGAALRAPDYLAIAPSGRVPALEIDGRALFETGAIVELLCERHPSPLWRGPGDAERADWLQWLHFGETIAVHIASLTQQHVVLREEARSPALMKIERRRLENALQVVADRLVDRDTLLAGGFSAADIMVGYGVHIARHFTDHAQSGVLGAYHARCAARPAFQRALPPVDAELIYRQALYCLPD